MTSQAPKCKGYPDRGRYKGACPHDAVPKSNTASGEFCEYCSARSGVLSAFNANFLDGRNEKICKGESNYGDEDGCKRRAVLGGYCLHCLTYYDSYDNTGTIVTVSE